MPRSYLKVALRNLRRSPGYTAINTAGLALGLACCILIALYVRDELSYDDFHAKGDCIVSVGTEGGFGGRMLATPYPLAGALKDEIPEVEQAVRTLWPGSGEVSLDRRQYVEEDNVFHAETDFFEVFSFPFIQGDAATALRRPNTAVISEALAAKYFLDDDPIGKTLHAKKYGEHTYEITGVARSWDNSYLDFDVVLSFSTLDFDETHADGWGASMFLTFAVLEEGVSEETLDAQVLRLAKEHLGEDDARTFFAQPITGLYLSDLVTVEGHLRTELVVSALEMTLQQRKAKEVIHHSDRGSQYTSIAFGERCRKAGVRPSMGSTCYDNAMCESFFAALECELIERTIFATGKEARLAVFEFIEGWYIIHTGSTHRLITNRL